MKSLFEKMKIRTKIYGGFSTLIVMFLVVTIVSIMAFKHIHHDIQKLQYLNAESELLSTLQDDLAHANESLIEWLESGEEKALEKAIVSSQELKEHIGKAQDLIKTESHLANLKVISEGNVKFFEGLENVKKLQSQEDEFVHKVMEPSGIAAREIITELATDAYKYGDSEAAVRAGFSNQELLLARLYARRYLDTHSEEDKKQYERHYAEFQKAIDYLDASIETPSRKQVLREAKKLLKEYNDAFIDAYGVVVSKNKAIKEDILGSSKGIEKAIVAINHDVVQETSHLDHEINNIIKSLKQKTIFFAVLSFIVGVTTMVFMVRSILKPVTSIRDSLSRLLDGDVTAEIPYGDLQDEIGEMAQSIGVVRDRFVNMTRVRNAMDGATSCVMMANPDLDIVYMNEAQVNMMRAAEADIKQELPNFNVNKLIGENIDVFHKNPAHQRGMLASLKSRYETRIHVGGRVFDLIALPLFNEKDIHLGFSVEWIDKTTELAVANEIKEIIASASKGDLDSRIVLEGKDGFFLEVSEGVNNLATVMQNVANDLADNLKALSSGDLTARIETEYEGLFLQLKDDYNATSEKLAEVMGTIKGISVDVKGNSDEMADSSSGLANRAEQQASTLEETAASMEELTSTVKTNADNAKEVNDAALKTRTIAEEGSRVANDAGHAMQKINESSKKITEIINVIDEIAFQTNLLALNAAVEAARAGDAGRGFAVVAQEVRTLAQRSAQSSKDIKTLIDDSSKQVGDGVELVETAVSSLQQIYDSIEGVADTIGQIATASSEQATSLDELNQAVMEMDSMTQQNAAMAQQSRNVAQIMQEKSDDLAEMVGFFNIDGSEPVAVKRPKAARVARQDEIVKFTPESKKTAAKSDVDDAPSSAASVSAHDEDDADWKEF